MVSLDTFDIVSMKHFKSRNQSGPWTKITPNNWKSKVNFVKKKKECCTLTSFLAHCCPKRDTSRLFPDPDGPMRTVTLPAHPLRNVSNGILASTDPKSPSLSGLFTHILTTERTKQKKHFYFL